MRSTSRGKRRGTAAATTFSTIVRVDEAAGAGEKSCVSSRRPRSSCQSRRSLVSAMLLASMTQKVSSRSRAVAGTSTAAIVALLGVFVVLSPLGNGLVQTSYDSLHRLCVSPADLTNSSVVIVYLDLDSYLSEHRDPSEPWPRELHAALVRRLTAAGARAIVFDVVFSGASTNEQADAAFAEAIRANGRVVLAAELNQSSQEPAGAAWPKTLTLELPYEPLRKATAAWGLASLSVENDYVVRRYFPGFLNNDQPTLTWAAARLLRLPLATNAADALSWVRYYGPPLTLPHRSYHSALRPGDVPDEIFRDKIVFIGARPFVEGFRERRDELRSPFRRFGDNHLFMPAVEIHATQMINLVRGDWLRRLSRGSEIGVLIATACTFGFGLMGLRPLAGSIVALVGAGAALFGARYAFQQGVWFPWLIVSAVQIPAALGISFLFHFAEWYRTRRRMEAAKRVADAKIREQAALIDKAHDAILVQDLTGRVLYANPSAEKLYGWSLAELQRDGGAGKIFESDSTKAAEARAAVLDKGDWIGELRPHTRSGRKLIVEARWTLIHDEANQPTALLTISTDVTDKKQLEAQFLRTQRMETIGSLAGGMAHDLNNALSPVLLGVQLLRRKSADEETTRILGLMESSTHRGADMVRQVLLFARGREGDFERVNIGAVLKEIAKMARETFPKGIMIESFVPADLHAVRGNVTQLHQVMLNLCVNARDAMLSGGKISLVADNVELSADEAAQFRNGTAGEFISVSVSDTGSGMSPEVQSKIFEPFFTTKAEGQGTGLGLATVQRIVKNHGGFVRVESERGQGTTFEVLLPRAVEVAATAAADSVREAPRGDGELILVIDDERAIRDLLAEGLIAHGYRVFTAGNGVEALQIFQQPANEVQLVITDSAMPVMDGTRAISELRKLRADLPIIVASADENTPGTVDWQTLGIKKPFALEEVLDAIARLLTKSAKPPPK